MPRLRLAGVAVALVVAPLLATPRADASVPTVDRWAPGRPGVFMDHFNDNPLDVRLEAPRRRIITLNAYQWPMIDDIKAANPDTLVLVYKSASSTRNSGGLVQNGRDSEFLPTGVGYVEADSQHPEWFATRDGHRLEWRNWPGYWLMRVDNPAYQTRWIENVRDQMDRYGWDGVVMDDLLSVNTGYTTPGPYADDAAMRAAMRSFLARVGPALSGAGFLTVANIPAAYAVPGMWGDWMQFLDGGAEEHFTNWSSTAGSGFVSDWGTTGWRAHIEEIATAERMGKFAMVSIGGVAGDRAAALYGFASYLLTNGGRSMVAHGDEGWEPEFAYRLGNARGSYYSLGNSVYRRDFVGGTAVVNASASRTATISLGGRYLNGSGQVVTSITLGPTRGAVLRTP
jgi:Hypothetical glycosyl hydrolase family 15